MKDPSEEISNAVSTALTGNVTYDSETVQVFEDMPEMKIYKYILIDEVFLTDDSTNDSPCLEGRITIEAGMYGWGYQTNRTAVNSVVNSILQLLVHKTLSTTTFYITIDPYLLNTTTIKERIENDTLVRRVFDLGIRTQEK